MYHLTVDVADACTVTEHRDREGAHGRLMRHVVAHDYYLRTVRTGSAHTTYELLSVDRDPVRPRSAGHAVIERVDPAHGTAVDSPRVAAVAARAWIARHRHAWRYGHDTEPGDGHAAAVLTVARAEARTWLPAGTLLPEAARLAGVPHAPVASAERLESLRRNAVHSPQLSGERLADAVTTLAPADTPASALTVLVWWYALISWGVAAP